jgi:hypothetical protein
MPGTLPGTLHHSTMQDEPLLTWRLLLFLLTPILFLLFFRGRLRSWLLTRRWRRSGLRRRRWLMWAIAWRWGHCPWNGLASVWIGPVRFRTTGFRRATRLRAVCLRLIRPVIRWRRHWTIHFRAVIWLRRRRLSRLCRRRTICPRTVVRLIPVGVGWRGHRTIHPWTVVWRRLIRLRSRRTICPRPVVRRIGVGRIVWLRCRWTICRRTIVPHPRLSWTVRVRPIIRL